MKNCENCGALLDVKLLSLEQIQYVDNAPTLVFCSLLCKQSHGTKKKPKHKFKATRTETDEIKFGSKAEAAYYNRLKMLRNSGEVLFFLRQVPFDLPGATKYFVDFQVFYADGTIAFVDVKGMSTPMFILKKKQVESLYPIEIEIVKI